MASVIVRGFDGFPSASEALWEIEYRCFLIECGCPNVDVEIANEKHRRELKRRTEADNT